MTTVLVTRPAGQEATLMAHLADRGYHCLHQPALTIEPLALSAQDRSLLAGLSGQDMIIVVSTNAARLLADVGLPLPAAATWLAVGSATAEVLAEQGLTVAGPGGGMSSEDLLALEPLQDVAGQRVVIVGGVGGRELLQDQLAARGAQVHPVALYRRSCDAGFRWPAEPVDVLMVTSLESWQCLAEQVPPGVRVLAGSERIARRIREQYRGDVRAANSPLDADMLAALETLS